jgi:alkanesulfonate monooxygenase SsuD/methylene tetrahydromethanopterin reductase-like flavin-dependent oxidoreductase (luciferase family)
MSVTLDLEIGNGRRAAIGSTNRLKLGLFGANCSSGRAVTRVPERWSGSWPDCVRLAQMADRAGIEFMLPIGRWKGYGGDTDYQGATWETVAWACGLLAKTEQLTVFGTVHAPLIAPLIAAKEFVTADHIGEGRFGLNLVCGWNEGEFEMFGATLRVHEARYEYAQEWLDIVKLAWSPRESFDFGGHFFKLQGVRAKPKPYGGTRPLIMNAGASPTGQAFAIRNCDALFSTISRGISFEETARHVRSVRAVARQSGRDIDVYTVGVRHLPAHGSGGAGLLSACRGGQCRLGSRRQYSGDEEHHTANPLARKIAAHPQSPDQWHGRAATGRRPGCGGAGHGAAGRAGAQGHRGFVRQLPRRIAVLLRRGVAASGALGAARQPGTRMAGFELSRAVINGGLVIPRQRRLLHGILQHQAHITDRSRGVGNRPRCAMTPRATVVGSLAAA